jgi:Uma2 family endonuclease
MQMQMRWGMPGPSRLVTAEEFAQIPDDDHRYELIEGRVIRMSPPGSRHAVTTTRVAALLYQYVAAHRLGVVMSTGGFRLATNPDTVREPDVAFVRRDRIPDEGVPDSFWPGAPDLAIEIRSPGDRLRDVRAKVDNYLTRGVRLVWVIDPKKATVTIYRPDSAHRTLGADDVLDAADVVPGFTCAVRSILE